MTAPLAVATLLRCSRGEDLSWSPTIPLDAMPHPKRRTSKARKGIRRSHLGTTPEALQRDPRSGALTRPHRINEKESTHYGFKKGGQEGFQVFEREDF